MSAPSNSADPEVARRAVEQALAAYLSGRASVTDASFTTEPMPGGASTRKFFRVRLGESESLVAMFVPLPSQEIQKAAKQTVGIQSFVEVRQLLADHHVPVPVLHLGSHEHNVLLVEDLGDDTLAQYLLRAPERREDLYRGAVLDLARAQKRLGALPPNSIVRERAFDVDLLRWEIDHFREWALAARDITLTNDDRAVFERARDHLAETIASWPRGFVHRDFQSRNLMVRGAEAPSLSWIDFQDAMLGPRVYDLVALLTDSYQTFSREFVEARLLEYAREWGLESEIERITYEFDFVTVQRKLKDAGRFIFIERVNQNPNFLPFVEPTIAKARAALRRVATEGPLRDLEEMLDRILAPTMDV